MVTSAGPLEIAVVGCGSAGGASALYLSRAGHRVTVFEAVPDPKPVGAGILLQPTGMAVLAELGVLGQVLPRGARVESLYCHTPSGRSVIDLAYGSLREGLFGLGTHRGLLFEAIFDAVQEAEIELRTGVAITSMQERADKRELVDEDGEVLGAFDLVVVADGARSQLRAATGLTRRDKRYPWGALWLVAEDPDRIFRGQLYQVVRSTRTMLGFLPTGLGPASAGNNTPKTSMFWSVAIDRVDALKAEGTEAFRHRVLELVPQAEPLVAQIEDVKSLVVANYYDVVLKRWHDRNVVLLGDAAHAMSPQLGQGANLALFDAKVLAECVGEEDTVPAALAAYNRRRYRQLGYYQLMTRWLTPFFQSDVTALGWLRDLFMGPVCAIGPARQQMIRTMAGIKRGLIRPSMALPPPPKGLLTASMQPSPPPSP
ncbi:MAG: NAD(P)/FAD-dependent oxidoreductase [Myxococcota bacterium]